MIRKTAITFSLLLLSATFSGSTRAQNAAPSEGENCMPTSEQVSQQLQMFARRVAQPGRQVNEPGTRNVTVSAIPGVVAAGVEWKKVWQEGGNSADGILATRDGSVSVAQEDYDTVLKIDANGKSSVLVAGAKGVGALSMDHQGNLYGALRTERPGSTKPDKDS